MGRHSQKLLLKLKVILVSEGEEVMIKDAPFESIPTKDSSVNVLVKPILDHAKLMGISTKNKSFKYYSEADKMDVLIGSDPIDKLKLIPVLDLDPFFSPTSTKDLKVVLKVRDHPEFERLIDSPPSKMSECDDEMGGQNDGVSTGRISFSDRNN